MNRLKNIIGELMEYRALKIEEIDDIWKIDRTEHVDSIYIMNKKALIEKNINRTFHGWPPDEDKIYGPILTNCYRNNGFFLGGYEEEKLRAIVVLDTRPIGKKGDTLQLKFLHIDRRYRKKGIGGLLFKKAVEKAKQLNAGRIYISACENKNTVEFYRHMGCKITNDVDDELFKLEPNDIHMDLIL